VSKTSFSTSWVNNSVFSVSDSFLARAVSSMPKQSILLIEDIDCAFPSREDEDQDIAPSAPPPFHPQGVPLYPPYGPLGSRSTVTLSGLLNVLDGVGSEEGRLFFATVRSSEYYTRSIQKLMSSSTPYRQTMSIDLTRPFFVLDASIERWNIS